MVNDSIADYCTRIRNAYMVNKITTSVSYNKVGEKLSQILVKEGYIEKYKVKKPKEIVIHLKYDGENKPALDVIERISKPGLRIYKRVNQIRRVLSGKGLAIYSTSKGFMTDSDAGKNKLGGELVCQVW